MHGPRSAHHIDLPEQDGRHRPHCGSCAGRLFRRFGRRPDSSESFCEGISFSFEQPVALPAELPVFRRSRIRTCGLQVRLGESLNYSINEIREGSARRIVVPLETRTPGGCVSCLPGSGKYFLLLTAISSGHTSALYFAAQILPAPAIGVFFNRITQHRSRHACVTSL
ncbi:hypothetical protein Lepil_0982 [Leptonema illini DSM 21528]|uniref:Uncharacterized protein n=1 Tax=Leptonema illini DSM 21528 TaxID=929563 RepID=H2CFL7_9LEPT|nr:hypothetical protein Lepil_0982 [Leptonema illini DSM 21528]